MHKALISLILAFLTCISACAVHVPRSPQPEPFGQDDPAVAREAYVQAKAAWERQDIQTAFLLGLVMLLAIIWLRISWDEGI